MSDREELQRLRKENRALKRKIRLLEKGTEDKTADEAPRIDCYGANNYFSYLLARIKEKSFYTRVEKFSRYFKNSMLVTRIFRYGLLLYRYLQTGAFVLLYTALFIIAIPIILAVAALTLILTLILRRRNADRLLRCVRQSIVFLIPDGKEGFDAAFLRAQAFAYPDSTVIVVSPFFLRRTGIGDTDAMYVCYRKEGENVFLARSYFFFYLRRRLQNAGRFTLTEIKINKDTVLN